MFKLLSSIFLAALLATSCADSPSTETNETTTTSSTEQQEAESAAPSAVTVAHTTTEEETTTAAPVEEGAMVDNAATEAAPPESAPAAAPEPKEEVIKDMARPRSEEVEEAPAPAPAPKPATTTNKTATPPATTTSTTSSSTAPAPKNIDAKPAIPPFSHDKFDALLRKHVSSSGKVNYKSFKKDKAVLEDYINLLQLNAPKSDWSKNKQMAYWINLYNAFTINTILDKYPVNSITDIEGGKVWDRKTINIGGEKLTLNDIEKTKLLKRFKDGRVHFAVNCAAASCPPLLNKAWTEDNLQRYLSKQTKAFINNTTENQLSGKSIKISQIFNWYAGDFGGKDKIVAYFQKYSEVAIKDNAKVSFNEYKWDLND